MTPQAEEPAKPKGRIVYVVLPVYNEEGRIQQLLTHIDEAMQDAGIAYEIVLVDDGSRDSTADLVRAYAARMPIRVLRHEVNQGLGATIRDGLMAAASVAADRDIIVTMDADDTHAPGLILRMVRMISEGHDVVIASRYRPGSRTVGVPLTPMAPTISPSTLMGNPPPQAATRASVGTPAKSDGSPLIKLKKSRVETPSRAVYALFCAISMVGIGAPFHPAECLEIAAVIENRYALADAKFSGFRHRCIHHFLR